MQSYVISSAYLCPVSSLGTGAVIAPLILLAGSTRQEGCHLVDRTVLVGGSRGLAMCVVRGRCVTLFVADLFR